MKQSDRIETLLSENGISPTPNRVLVLGLLAREQKPMSLADIEACIWTLERSSIFRVLKLFQDKGVIHTIDDGSSITKYLLCDIRQHNAVHSHAHFYCDRCRQIITIESPDFVPLKLPKGCTAHEINYVVHGICMDCAEKP